MASRLEEEQEINHNTDGDQKNHIEDVHSLVSPPGYKKERKVFWISNRV